MTEWKAKRFWKAAQVAPLDGGFTVQLDTRTVKTPAKAALKLPTEAMAHAIAAEWDAQVDFIDPRTMPVTRAANAAIDKVGAQREEVVASLAEYGDSDLLCYRAAGPEGLIGRQAAGWDPLLDWAAETFGARLWVGEGVMHVAQDPAVLDKLRRQVDSFDNFALAGVHDLISLSGSLILALAVTRDRLNPDEAWSLSRIDEDWQIAQWGDDEEASAAAAVKRQAFLDAARFYGLSIR
ncbi:ATP12 family chaperone protein [Yoonia sp. 2307UL14-13]|uniref:ATP12 family chaperone protein n=1 Tax=Yoonia sp. 2307UL14-13 TaxID=3126506 RepID=UPI003099A87B